MRNARLSLALACALLPLSQAVSAAEAPKVVASIKPVHSLVAGVMKGAGQPGLIVAGGGSPHSYSLKPSEAAALQDAQMVVWVGDELETFLEGPIETLAADARVVSLTKAPGVSLLAFREGGPWAEHGDHDDHAEHAEHGDHDHHDDHAKHEEHDDHGDHDHGDHDHHAEHAEHDDHAHDHAHGEHADHDDHAEHKAHDDHDHHDDHAEHASHDEHDEHAGHHHGEHDMHIWLDPENAKAIVGAAAEALIDLDPAHAGIYRANRDLMVQRLDGLSAEIATELTAVRDAPFVVFHDAYQYMERRFGLNTVGSITVSPERQPGAARLKEIQEKISELGARCVFSEPQFEPRLVGVVVEGTGARTGVLDPLGATLQDGPDLYFELMRRNAAALRTCLAESS